MIVLGVTGASGSGKSTLSQQAEALGGRILDCDAIYHELLANCTAMREGIRRLFPTAFSQGGLDRKKLGAQVFADEGKLRALNDLTHPFVLREVEKRLCEAQEDGCPLAVIEAIALIESGLGTLCDLTVCVTAPQQVRVERLMARENISREYALLRVRAQKSEDELAAHCTMRLKNNDTAEEFEAACKALLENLIKSNRKEG